MPPPSQDPGPAPDMRQWVDSPEAPGVLALSLSHEFDQAGARKHRHDSGQLYCLSQGMMTVRTGKGLFASLPRCVGWIPPRFEHAIVGPGPVKGWTVFVRPDQVAGLPEGPALLACSRLLEPLVERLAESGPADWHAAPYQRMSQVLLDELHAATQQKLSLPLPEDRRLRAIARVLMQNPADPRSGAELALWAGLSPRSLSRHWTQAVGMSIAKYRQVARILNSLDGLAKGRDVQQVAWDVGFESVSAYINAFRQTFGFTPGKYLAARP
ncbi:AraC family transcriptional regulator [Bordetella hinzii]|uniref:AraC family transcriptional regulator n=1 Tax=Bordetella hinzii TaxID=103855 RepID=UPI0039FD6C63